MNNANFKVEAIYELRAAAVEKGKAEKELDANPTPENRDALLEAQTRLEDRTVRALDACETCHHPHRPDEPHGPKVIPIDRDRR